MIFYLKIVIIVFIAALLLSCKSMTVVDVMLKVVEINEEYEIFSENEIIKQNAFTNHFAPVYGLDISDDSQYLVSAARFDEFILSKKDPAGNVLKVWKISDGSLVRELFKADDYGVVQVIFANNDKWLIYATKDGKIKILDIKTGALIKEIITDHEKKISNLYYDFEKNLIVSSSLILYRDKVIKFWDINTGNLIYEISDDDIPLKVYWNTFFNVEKMQILLADKKQIKTYNVNIEDKKYFLDSIINLNKNIIAFTYNQEAICATLGNILSFRIITNCFKNNTPNNPFFSIKYLNRTNSYQSAISLSYDGRWLVKNYINHIDVYDLVHSYKPKQTIKHMSGSKQDYHFILLNTIFSKDNQWLVSSSGDGTVMMWNLLKQELHKNKHNIIF